MLNGFIVLPKISSLSLFLLSINNYLNHQRTNTNIYNIYLYFTLVMFLLQWSFKGFWGQAATKLWLMMEVLQ